MEDVPRHYVQKFIVKKQVWRKRPNLWRALAMKGLVMEEPPPAVVEANTEQSTMLKVDIPRANELNHVNFVFDFGKHAGKTWDQVPESYRDWLLRNQVWKSHGRENFRNALVKSGFEPPE